MRRRIPLIYIERPYSNNREFIVAQNGRWIGVVEKCLRGWRVAGKPTIYPTKEAAGQKLAATRGEVYR